MRVTDRTAEEESYLENLNVPCNAAVHQKTPSEDLSELIHRIESLEKKLDAIGYILNGLRRTKNDG